MNLSPINLAMGMAGIALLGGIALAMLKRRLHRQLPLFFLYACCAALILIIDNGIGAKVGNETFFKIYWVSEALYSVTGLLAMYESFRKVFEVYAFSKSSRRFVLLLPVMTVLAVLSISVWALVKHSPTQASRIALFYISFALATDYMLAGFFGLFVILVFLLHARWQRYAFGIMKGFGFFSIVGMLADLLRSQFGTKWDFFFSYAPPVAYILSCLIWLGAFLAPEERKLPGGPGSAVDLDEILQLLGKLTKVIK